MKTQGAAPLAAEVTHRTRLMVLMRDGVHLSTDVYSAEPLDTVSSRVILERTPYGIREPRGSDGFHADGAPVTPESGSAWFVKQGWVVVRQDCRGRGDSEGVFVKYVNEAQDGYDTAEWLAAQPWCDGTIATTGVSYSAHAQAATASAGSTRLAAMILDSGGFASAYETGGRFGGAFELKQVLWAWRQATRGAGPRESPALRAHLSAIDMAAWFDRMPWRQGDSPLATAPEFENYLFDQWQHETLDDYWRQPALYSRGYYNRWPKVPVMCISSWYDPYVLSAVDNFQAARHTLKVPARLVLGPWIHGARSRSFAGEVDFGAAAPLDGNLGDDYLSFRHQWLVEAIEGTVEQSIVDYFLMGGGGGGRSPNGRLEHGGAWHRSTTWPPTGSATRSWALHQDGLLAAVSATGSTGVRVGAISFDFDPSSPVPSRGGGVTSGEPLMSGGAFDQTAPDARGRELPLSSRADVVAFRTAPLEHALAIAGPVEIRLAFSSSAPDTDVTVKLIDEYPPSDEYPEGFAMNLTDGMLRCRFRDGFDEVAEPMSPGVVYGLEIRVPDVANLFQPGHRLRLDVSSSNFPRVDVNPNTGAPVVGDRTRQVARNTIHFSGSELRLSVLGAVLVTE